VARAGTGRLVLGGGLLVLLIVLVVAVVIGMSSGSSKSASGPTTTSASNAEGAALFAANCAVCHGAQAQGGITTAPRLAGVVKTKYPDVRVQRIIVSQGTGAMPGFQNKLTPAEIQAVVDYTRSLT
jgi:mono/diheme cytochrome c family protein